ncbi:hypothetical protein EDD85DRAFT_793813 [Armillaria nabsnona]|nr:hypothetical protein EDD85DRAFT_793813 [Armillaria nabsnona]
MTTLSLGLFFSDADVFFQAQNMTVSAALMSQLSSNFPRVANFQPAQTFSSINTLSSASGILKWIAEFEEVVVVVLKGIQVKHYIKLGNCSSQLGVLSHAMSLFYGVRSILDERSSINKFR